MKILKTKKSRRLGMVVLVCGLAFATLVWRECASTEIGDMDRDGIDAFAGFLAYRLKEGPKGSPSQEVGDTQLIALGHDVEKFRGAAVMVDDTKALAGLPEVAPGAFDDFLKGEISAKFPFIWPYVIAGSLTMMANALGDEPVAAFYNPYFDVAILTKWKFEAEAAAGPGYQLIEAVPVSGRAFLENRATQSTDQPIWADSPARLFEIGIVKAVENFVAAFEERYPPYGHDAVVLSSDAGSANVAVALVEERVFFLMRWVIDAQDASAEVNYSAAIQQLREALSDSSPDKLEALLPRDNPQRAEFFFDLDDGVCEGMRPYLVVKRNVIFVNPLFPKVFLSVYFEPGDAGYRPELVALFNLGADILTEGPDGDLIDAASGDRNGDSSNVASADASD